MPLPLSLPFPGLCIFLRLFPLHNLTYCESPLPFHFLASVRSAYPNTLRVQTGCGGGGSDRIGAVCDRRRCGDRDRESEISDGDATRHEPCHPSIDRSRVWDPGPGSLWTMVETSSQRSGVDLDLDHHHHRAPGTEADFGASIWEVLFSKQRKVGRDGILQSRQERPTEI